MLTRKLTGLVALALVLGLSSVASAADKYVAYLDPSRIEPRADGRALWMATPNEIHFSVGIENCRDHEAVWVLVNGDPIGRVSIDEEGFGTLHVNMRKDQKDTTKFPRVTAGSSVMVIDADGEVILYGKFREFRR